MAQTDDVPGIRPDKAEITCGNCGHVFEARGFPCDVDPNARIPASCPDCPVNGIVHHNRFAYIADATGEIEVRRVD